MPKKGLEWNQVQLKIAYDIIVNHMNGPQIEKASGLPHKAVWKVADAVSHGDKPPTLDLQEIAKAPPPTPFAKKGEKKPAGQAPAKPKPNNKDDEKTKTVATATLTPKAVAGGLPVNKTAFIDLIAQVRRVPMTPDIYISYMCALQNGFHGEIDDWLSLVSRDFWAGRGRNMFAEASGANFKKEVPKDGNAPG